MGIMQTMSSIIDLAKRAKMANDALRDSESKLVMAELISNLAELKLELSDLIYANHNLREQVAKLMEQKEKELTLVGDVYMADGDGPFCTTCCDLKSLRVRLKEEIADVQMITGLKYVCPACETRHKGIKLGDTTV